VDYVCVYCGSSPGARPDYVSAAATLGRALVDRGLGLVYGGANRGTMGAIADTVLAAGGEVVGVIPHGLVNQEVAHRGLTELITVETLHERKARMLELSCALVTMPGGYGTHDELFEALSWLQLGIHEMPVGLLNVRHYFDGLLAHLEHAVAEGFLKPEHHQMLLVESDPEALLDRCRDFVPPERPSWRSGA